MTSSTRSMHSTRHLAPPPPDNEHCTHAPSPCSFNMMEAARVVGIKRFFYASSACIYPGAPLGKGQPGRRATCVHSGIGS